MTSTTPLTATLTSMLGLDLRKFGGYRLLLIVAVALCPLCALAVPTYEEVVEDWRSSETLIEDRRGEVIHRLRTDPQTRRGRWVTLSETSAALRYAIILSEDKRFYEHSGIDWQAASSAAWSNLWNQKTRGASTVTMQLAGLLDDDWRRGPGGRSVIQKIGQAIAAARLEQTWTKSQILEAYLNLAPFKGEIVGIDALSRTLFNKTPQGLTNIEAALATALIRSPNAPVRQVSRRACDILRRMTSTTDEGCEAVNLAAAGTLGRKSFLPSEGVAPHFARKLSAPIGTARIRTTLDGSVQRFANEQLQRHLKELAGRQVNDAALVVLDNATGDVLAWVGSSGSLSHTSEFDGVTGLRQPGSTLKPFLYGLAFAQRRLTAGSLIEDSPAQIATTSGLYIPENYDHQFKGWVSVRTALASSLNVPAVRALELVGPDDLTQQLKDLGLPLRQTGGFYGYSLALGSAEVSLISLTNAYRALANGGQWSKPRFVLSDPRPPVVQVFDPAAAFIVGDILSDTNARARTFGADSILNTRSWTAVKTGTSKDMRDNWAIGWSDRYTVGVWVGNSDGSPMRDVSGTSGAAPIWVALMTELHRDRPSKPPSRPPQVEEVAISFGYPDSGRYIEAARNELFISGTAQNQFTFDANIAGLVEAARILSPTHGTVVALDPDIPPNNQQLVLETQGASNNVRWVIDGKPFSSAPRSKWPPWPGRHHIRLETSQGVLLDQVDIEVRGAGVKKPTRKPHG